MKRGGLILLIGIFYISLTTANPQNVVTSNLRFQYATPTSNPSPFGPANNPPTVTWGTTPTTGNVGQQLTFSVTATDSDGPENPRPYWDFGDDTYYAIGSSVTHTYTSPGTYTIKVMASDNFDLTTAQKTIIIS